MNQQSLVGLGNSNQGNGSLAQINVAQSLNLSNVSG